jgi:aspartate aminotransferase
MVELPVEDADHFAQWLLEEFQWEGATVMVAPAAGFYATPGLGTREVRIAYVLEKAQLKKAVQILGKALEIYPG